VILARQLGGIPGTLLDRVIPNVAESLGVTSAGGAYPSPAPLGSTYPVTSTGGAHPSPAPVGSTCPVTGVAVPSVAPGQGDLRRQAHELVGALLSLWTPAPSTGTALPGLAAVVPAGAPTASHPESAYPQSAYSRGLYPHGLNPESWAGKRCPETHAAVPTFAVERDQIRRQAHELIETLLITFNEATGEKGLPAENQVPLLSCAAPVQPGDTGRATLSVANEESTAIEVTLYCTNFVADQGHEIPSLRVTILPRVTSIPAQGKADFEINIRVPEQTAKGYYCGLIQAMGSRYFKAVLSLEVL